MRLKTMFSKIEKLFPNGKPTLEEFVITLYKDLESKI